MKESEICTIAFALGRAIDIIEGRFDRCPDLDDIKKGYVKSAWAAKDIIAEQPWDDLPQEIGRLRMRLLIGIRMLKTAVGWRSK